MNSFVATVRPTVVSLALFTVLCGVVYPSVCTLALQGGFGRQAQGSLITGRDGTALGSALVGQNFSDKRYFWGRLSATSPYPYNAASSSGSNLGSNNPALMDAVKARVDVLTSAGAHGTAIPVDLVTASGSGLDPHISLAGAQYQLARVAEARGIDIAALQSLVAAHTQDRQWGLLGEPVVNVLELNLALDGKL